jgi:hypothetical protein
MTTDRKKTIPSLARPRSQFYSGQDAMLARKTRAENRRSCYVAGRTRAGSGIGVLALLRDSTVMKTMSLSPIFSRSWTLNSPSA